MRSVLLQWLFNSTSLIKEIIPFVFGKNMRKNILDREHFSYIGWFRLNSKTGKKEKERGDIQVTVLFTRNNLTASMYDLVMKDKSASTFGKLKERIRGKRRSSDEDSSGCPSDGGGEEDYEDDEGGEARRSKMRTFFLRGKLRKSSDTRSSTSSLGSESSESSSPWGGSLSPTAGISVVVSDLSNSPSNSSNLTVDNSPEHTANTSPKSSSLKCEFGDEAGEISIAVPQPTVCVNGSHAYSVQPQDPGSGKPTGSLGLGLLQKSLPLSMSLQNLSPRPSADLPKGPVGDGRRWSFDKPGEEEKAAITAALEQSGPMLSEEEQAVLPKAASCSVVSESESQGKKQRRNLFSHGRSESAGKGQSQSKDESEQAPATAEEKHKGWFGSKDSHSKPSLVVSPKLEPSTDPHPPNLHPLGPPVDPASLVSPLHHTNPFSHSQSTSPPTSPCNPFFSLLRHNPFYEDMLTAQHLKPSLPPLPYLSSSRPPIAQLFPSNPNPTLTHDYPTKDDSITGTDANSKVMAKDEKRPLPPAPTEGKKPLSKKSSNPFMSARELEPDSEWDESFEAFAAGRLQSPEDPTTDCKTQQNTPSDHLLERCNNKGALLPTAGADRNTNVNDALHHRPEFIFKAHEATGQVTNANTHHFDSFAQFLETIPEHTSFESDSMTLNAPANSPTPPPCTETIQANSTTNTKNLTDTNMQQTPCHASSAKLDSSSPDPGSSGLGSSAEEDFLSCLSSYSDKLSASSSEEAEAQHFGSEKSSDSDVVKDLQPSETEDDITDRSNDLSLVEVGQDTIIQQSDGDEKLDVNSLEGSPQSPEPVITARETGSEGADPQIPDISELQPKSNVSLQSNNETGAKGADEFNGWEVSHDPSVVVSNTADLITSTTPDDELCSTHPLLYITTSSPDVKESSSDPPIDSASLGGQDANQRSPVPFELFGNFLSTSHIANSPGRSFDDTLSHTWAFDQSAGSFLQSLYVSADSQGYQTCESHPSSKCCSETNKTLHSANSTLCVELSEIQTTADAALGQEESSDAWKPKAIEEINQTDRSEEDKTATLEPSFMIGGDFGSLPAGSYTSCNPRRLTEGGVESQQVVLGDVFLKCPEVKVLQRSHSEGTLTPAFDELLLPSFGSDPGAIQESSSAQPSPDLPSLTSFAPSLTPDSSSSPIALRSLHPLAVTQRRGHHPARRELRHQSLGRTSSSRRPFRRTEVLSFRVRYLTVMCVPLVVVPCSPHPVKPLTTAMLAEEKRTEGRSVLATGLEKLKSTINPGRGSQLSEQETERKKSATEGAGSYYHLNHSELVALLVQREAELERQKAEFERQKFLLAKREVELKKLKPQVRDLEDYIDTLLVRIMEQKPTLLQSTFSGRFRHFLDVIDPSTLFVTEKRLQECVELLDRFKQRTLPPGVTDAQLWQAQKIKQAIIHPDTGEKILMPFRMSGTVACCGFGGGGWWWWDLEACYVVQHGGVVHPKNCHGATGLFRLSGKGFIPFGTPVVVGLLLPNQTLLSTIFWQHIYQQASLISQWLNQSHNACVNYCNRNASKPAPVSKFVQGYLGAVTSAVGIAVGLNVLIQRAGSFSPTTRLLVQRFIPFPAVASANVCNVVLMRHSELSEGISVLDDDGNVVGTSRVAARHALLETALTRVVLPMPILVLPPMIMAALEKLPLLQRWRRLVLPVHSLVCLTAFGLALPLAISLFPQMSQISVSQLEPEIAMATDCKTVTYNKGL
ncbi:hypothetical protein L3Q82_026270 [Scortum barcoo]|uniref:Uncharacterized protein n=1 Tax=Scortum barcoo TaxID=214431 RepID=A0ACB8WH95_9TELE|nr:hypothetical protein L3Q82_026270 [Scortum barcoo]